MAAEAAAKTPAPPAPDLAFLARFCVGFGAYGLGCLAFIALIPVLRVLAVTRARHVRWVQAWNHAGFRVVRRSLRWLGFIDMAVAGGKSRPDGRLLVANHISMFDIVAAFAHFPRLYTLVHAKYLRNPLIAPVIRAAGFIPVDPADAASRRQALARVEALLAQGETVIVFPEGTRSRDGSLGAFEVGAFRLACALGQAVTPVFFTSDQDVFSRVGWRRATRGRVRFLLHVGPAFAPPPEPRNRVAGRIFRDMVWQYFALMQASRQALPWNRRPMNYLGSPLRIDDAGPGHVAATYHVTAGHPDFAGHFPRFPVLPGVSQIELVMELLSRCLGSPVTCRAVRRAKFVTMIKPDTSVGVRVRFQDGEAQWTIMTPEATVSKGTIAYAHGDDA